MRRVSACSRIACDADDSSAASPSSGVEKDRFWDAYPLNLPAARVRVVNSTQQFESARLVEC